MTITPQELLTEVGRLFVENSKLRGENEHIRVELQSKAIDNDYLSGKVADLESQLLQHSGAPGTEGGDAIAESQPQLFPTQQFDKVL